MLPSSCPSSQTPSPGSSAARDSSPTAPYLVESRLGALLAGCRRAARPRHRRSGQCDVMFGAGNAGTAHVLRMKAQIDAGRGGLLFPAARDDSVVGEGVVRRLFVVVERLVSAGLLILAEAHGVGRRGGVWLSTALGIRCGGPRRPANFI